MPHEPSLFPPHPPLNVVLPRLDARVGILFDWDNWHALDDAIGPTRDKRYYQTVCKHYLAFYRKNIPVDVVFPDSDLSQYDIVIAPMMYMVKAGLSEKIESLVSGGGTFVTTYFSGIVDETDLAFENGYPGPLSNVLGIWVEEIDAMYEGQTNTIVMNDGQAVYSCSRLADLLHAQSAEVLATYGEDFYKGMPALTRNDFGKGSAYYVASDPDDQFLDNFYAAILQKHAIVPAFSAPQGVEITIRHKDNHDLVFVLNHNPDPVTIDFQARTFHDLLTDKTVTGSLSLAAYDVYILVEQTSLAGSS